jgi:hypothetical protein
MFVAMSPKPSNLFATMQFREEVREDPPRGSLRRRSVIPLYSVTHTPHDLVAFHTQLVLQEFHDAVPLVHSSGSL